MGSFKREVAVQATATWVASIPGNLSVNGLMIALWEGFTHFTDSLRPYAPLSYFVAFLAALMTSFWLTRMIKGTAFKGASSQTHLGSAASFFEFDCTEEPRISPLADNNIHMQDGRLYFSEISTRENDKAAVHLKEVYNDMVFVFNNPVSVDKLNPICVGVGVKNPMMVVHLAKSNYVRVVFFNLAAGRYRINFDA